MKKYKIFIFTFICIIIIYNIRLEKIGRENIELSKNIKPGMTVIEVNKIMLNNPIKIENHKYEENELIYFYNSSFSSSGHIEITFDKNDSIVKRIYRGD